jgi:hypothetical protein
LKLPVNCGRGAPPAPRPRNAPLPLRGPLHATSRLTMCLASSTRTLSETQHTNHSLKDYLTPLSKPFHSTHNISWSDKVTISGDQHVFKVLGNPFTVNLLRQQSRFMYLSAI